MRYPETPAARNAWVTAARGPKAVVDRRRPGGWFVENERGPSGVVEPVLTLLLANRECPWKCVYCDLWRHTLNESVLPGDIPEQIRWGLGESRSARHLAAAAQARSIKLYNAGSFFDAAAIPSEDHPDVAGLVRGFERVIVECHPALIGERVVRFRDLLRAGNLAGSGPDLEVAMGLETADESILAQINKGLTLSMFRRAAEYLRREGVHLRTFVLVGPPFQEALRAVPAAVGTVEFALDCGARVVSLIGTRPGNGALERLREQGLWFPPRLAELESAQEESLSRVAGRGRIFADTWDLAPFAPCEECRSARAERLRRINDRQELEPRHRCDRCGLNAAGCQPDPCRSSGATGGLGGDQDRSVVS